MSRTLLFVAVCIALAGCGQTGPLYPQPEPQTFAGAAYAAKLAQLP